MSKSKVKSEKVKGQSPQIHFKLFAFAFLLLLIACAPASTDPKPPDIAYGRDVCDACGMIISDARFAAATLLGNGEARKFDDVGDMLLYHSQHPELQVRAWFVHDFSSQTWLRGEQAFYVVAKGKVISPMGSGIAAFASRADAETFAKKNDASVLTFEQMRLIVK